MKPGRQIFNVRLSPTIQNEYNVRCVYGEGYEEGALPEAKRQLSDGFELYTVDRALAESMLADAEFQICPDGPFGAGSGNLSFQDIPIRNAYKALIAQLRKELAK